MLTDKEIQDTVFAVLRRWKDDRAWDRFTRESGAYDVTSLRAEVMEIIKAVLVADGAIDDASLELGRLLNHIHGDSGQYVAVQGWKKAATDALAKLTTPGVRGITAADYIAKVESDPARAAALQQGRERIAGVKEGGND